MKKVLSVLFAILLIVQIGAAAFADPPVVTINPAEGGSATYTSVDGSVIATATPNPGYTFSMWAYSINGAGYPGSTLNPITIPVPTEGAVAVSITPKFDIQKHTINVTAGTGGSATGGGTYEHGKSVVVTALPNAGYNFLNWTEAGTEISSTPSFYTFADADHNYVANFVGQPHSITATVDPAGAGLVNGSASYSEGFIYEMGKTVTVTATPKEGYVFSGWYEGGTLISSSPSYSIDINRDRSIVAKFTASTPTTIFDPPSSGTPGSTTPITITPEQTGKIVITYMPDNYSTPTTPFQTEWYVGNVYIAGQYFGRTGYTQTGWALSAGGPKVYNLNSTTTLNQNLVLYPYWESVSVPLYLTVSIGPGGGVRLSGGNVPNGWTGKLEPNQSFTFYFHPNPGNYVYRIGMAGWHWPVQSGNSFTVTYDMMQGKNQTLQILFADARSHPPTGDDSQIALHIALGLTSLTGLIVLEVVRRKRNKEEE